MVLEKLPNGMKTLYLKYNPTMIISISQPMTKIQARMMLLAKEILLSHHLMEKEKLSFRCLSDTRTKTQEPLPWSSNIQWELQFTVQFNTSLPNMKPAKCIQAML